MSLSIKPYTVAYPRQGAQWGVIERERHRYPLVILWRGAGRRVPVGAISVESRPIGLKEDRALSLAAEALGEDCDVLQHDEVYEVEIREWISESPEDFDVEDLGRRTFKFVPVLE